MRAQLYMGDDSSGRHMHVPLEDIVHGVSFGASGLGKTFHLQHIIRQLWRLGLYGHRCSSIVIDPHGDLFDCLVADAYMFGMGDRVLVFDPRPGWLPALNPLRQHAGDVDVASLVLRAVQKTCRDLNPDQMPRLQRHLRALLRVLEGTELTLLEAHDFINDPDVRTRLVSRVNDPYVRTFWEQFDELTPRNREERIESTENRVDKLITGNQMMRRILGSTESSIDVGQVMDEGKHLLVNLGHAHLTHEHRRLLGSLLIETIFETAVRRPAQRRMPCYVVVDEAADFLCGDEDLPRALAQTRKYEVHFWLAVQMLAQLAEEHPILKSSVLTNANARVAFGGSREDSEIISAEMFTGRFAQDRVKHELYRTVHRPRETTRTVVTDAQGEAESDMQAHSSAVGSTDAHGSSASTGITYGPPLGLENVTMSITDSVSDVMANTSMTANTTAHGRARSHMHAEAIVPFLEPVEDQELSSIQFYTPDEERERYTALLKRQPPRHFFFQLGHHRTAVALRSPEVRPFLIKRAILERFLLRIVKRTGCMLEAETIDHQIETRRSGLRPRLGISSATAAKRPALNAGSSSDASIRLSPTKAILAEARKNRRGKGQKEDKRHG